MSDSEIQREEGLTRREVLKKGALLGGALAWGTPVVQVIGMRPALAQTTSPDCTNIYCLKAEVQGGVLGPFGPLGGGQGKGKGNCINETDIEALGFECDPNVPQNILDALNNSVMGDPENGFTITLPSGCRLLAEDSPDQFEGFGTSAAAKCGRRGGQDAPDPCFAPAVDGEDLTFTCGNGTEISHIELVICCV